MDTMIFVNLPVRDLQKSKEFFSKLGFSYNTQFTGEKAACMVIGKDIFVMLVANEYFQTFTPKRISDATQTSEVLLGLSAESRGKVDEMVRKAVAAGGSTYKDPDDHGMMYSHGFQDLDGHIWEVIWMDPKASQTA